jgi:hypothetical protein
VPRGEAIVPQPASRLAAGHRVGAQRGPYRMYRSGASSADRLPLCQVSALHWRQFVHLINLTPDIATLQRIKIDGSPFRKPNAEFGSQGGMRCITGGHQEDRHS